MTKLYSYVLRFDDGAAPNPFWGLCTLTICKPAIRRTAQIGDWVIGTGSKNTRLKDGLILDFSDSIVYAMKITDKLSLSEYDIFCTKYSKNKIPKWESGNWKLRMGDCVYDFSNGKEPALRKSVHAEINRKRDLSGNNSLLSSHFYYFGVEARQLPEELKSIVKRNQGHKIILQNDLVSKFENWINQFILNKIYADPQLRYEFDKLAPNDIMSKCSICHHEDDEYENEEIIC